MSKESNPRTEELVELWATIHSELESALNCAPRLSPDERGQVEHYIDVNELGLAWHTLVVILEQRGQPIVPEAHAALRRAAELMGDDLQGKADVVQRMEALPVQASER